MIEIYNAIMPFIKNAESFIGSAGVQNKEYVLNKVKQYAVKDIIKFDNESINSKIEELIEF